jgi:integrase
MAGKEKRQWGTGSIIHEKLGLAIRWGETIIGVDGRPRRKMRYELLGAISERKAAEALTDRIAAARRRGPQHEQHVPTFEAHATRWKRDVLPTYKFSVQLGHASILDNHLIPRFGPWLVSRMGAADVQEFITALREKNYAAHSIHHFHEVLRVVMREAVAWYGLLKNPAEGVRLPKLKPASRPWALTPEQCGRLLGALGIKARAMVALAIASGMRRGELLALKWSHLNEAAQTIHVEEAYYQGHLDTPKTEAGVRPIPVDPWVLGLLHDWRARSKRTRPIDLVFGTRTGNVENPNNVLRRQVYPACDALGIPRVSWLTCRRTFSTLAHHLGGSGKTIAELMGHTDVATQFIYIQGVDEMKRAAAGGIAEELSRFCPDQRQMGLPYVN